jgi:hypothetical protein
MIDALARNGDISTVAGTVCELTSKGRSRLSRQSEARRNMALGGPAIIARGWLNGLERRLPKDLSPAIKAYVLSTWVLEEIFGQKWVDRFVGRSRTPTFLLNNHTNDKEAATHAIRVIQMAEMLINSQWIPEYAACIQQLETAEQIEPTYAELDIARALISNKVGFKFNERQHKRGEDFDLLITCPNGMVACADTKCKLETTPFSKQTIKNAIDHARKQNLPEDRPGIVFVKVPVDWVRDAETASQLVAVANQAFTGRLVSVKFYTSYVDVIQDGIVVREAMSWHEIINRRSRFEPDANWHLFSMVSEPATSWNGMPPHWKRILKGDWI